MARPFIHLNCASTADGKLSFPDGTRLRISDEFDMRRVNRLRQKYGCILIGAGTVLTDDPSLTVKKRYVDGPRPLTKVVLDGKGVVSPSSRFLKSPGRSIIVTGDGSDPYWALEIETMGKFDKRMVEFIKLSTEGEVFSLSDAMNRLYGMGIKGILVEGGSYTLWSFISEGLFDRLSIYYGPMIVGGHGPTPASGIGTLSPIPLSLHTVTKTPFDGMIVEYLPKREKGSR